MNAKHSFEADPQQDEKFIKLKIWTTIFVYTILSFGGGGGGGVDWVGLGEESPNATNSP